jgi:hypothetical protein
MDDGIVVTSRSRRPYCGPSHGWGCDNVINYEMTVANRRIVNANEQLNRDL